jgi:hypothetical protein
MLRGSEKNLRFIRNEMEAANNAANAIKNILPGTGGISQSVTSIAIVVIGVVLLYYVYKFLFSATGLDSKALITTAIPANPADSPKPYDIPAVYEGGEYSITFWSYITAYKDQVGKAKHIVELSPKTTTGSPMSTLVVGLGPFNNKLMVRVNTGASGTEVLSQANVRNIFQPTQVPSGQLLNDTMPVCDLPEVDLQRWVCFGIVLNGRTVDVYMDGKLARSCVLPSFFKVDPNGVRLKALQYGGYDGFISNLYVYSSALNPEQMYRIYMEGPADTAAGGFLSWIGGIFNLKGEVTYTYPQMGLTYPTNTVTF